jgi:fatty acid desaturase
MSSTRRNPSSHPAGWKFWLRFALFPVAAFSLGFTVFNGFVPEQTAWQASAALFIGCCSFCVAGSYHEAIHDTLFSRSWMNRAYGRVAGILIFIPYTAFRETHRTHHAYLNTVHDYELWPYSDPARSRVFRRAFVVFELLGGWLASPLIFSRIAFACPPRLSPEVRRVIIREYVVMAAVWTIIVGVTAWLIQTGRVSGAAVVTAYLLPSMLAPGINALRKFTEHLGLASTNPVLGTRTVLGPGWATRIASYFNFDIAIHGPHHRYPRASHEQLPERLRELQLAAAPGAAPPVFTTFRAALIDVLPKLWRCPGVGATVLQDLGAPSEATVIPAAGPPLQAQDWDAIVTAG